MGDRARARGHSWSEIFKLPVTLEAKGVLEFLLKDKKNVEVSIPRTWTKRAKMKESTIFIISTYSSASVLSSDGSSAVLTRLSSSCRLLKSRPLRAFDSVLKLSTDRAVLGGSCDFCKALSKEARSYWSLWTSSSRVGGRTEGAVEGD